MEILNVNYIHLLRLVYTCNFCGDFRCNFLLLIDVNEWISYECSDKGTCAPNIRNSSILVHMHQKEKLALEIASKFASVNGPLDLTRSSCEKCNYLDPLSGIEPAALRFRCSALAN